MKGPDEKPSVDSSNMDGNAFAIMGTVSRTLKSAGADKEYIDKYLEEAKSGDYDNILRVSMRYCSFV